MQEQPMNVGSTAGEANNNDRGQTKHAWWFDWIKVLVVPIVAVGISVGVSWWIGNKQIKSAEIIADGQMKLQERIARDKAELQKQTAKDDQELKRLNQITTIFEEIISKKDGQDELKSEQILTKIASLRVYESTAIPFLIGIRDHYEEERKQRRQMEASDDQITEETEEAFIATEEEASNAIEKVNKTISAILSGSQIDLKGLNLGSGCDLSILLSDNIDKTKSIKNLYKERFGLNKFPLSLNECAVLVVEDSTNAAKEWIVAGYDDDGNFKKKSADDANNGEVAIELKEELNKEEIDRNRDRIIELAKSMLGRTLARRRPMRFAFFENYDLTGARFENMNLYHSNFKRSRLEGVIFKNSDLTDADFSSSNLKGSTFSDGTRLTYTDFSGAWLRDVEFNNVNCLEKATIYLLHLLKVDTKDDIAKIFDQLHPVIYTRLLSNNYMRVKKEEGGESQISRFKRDERFKNVVNKVRESNLCDTQRDDWPWWTTFIRQNQPMSKQALISCLEEVYETEAEWCD